MSEIPKLSFKRVEISLIKFNDVAVPHYIDVLKKHKDNILKYHNSNEYNKVQSEQVNATRVVKQLKQALYEIEMLRNQVLDCDLAKFDKQTEKSILMTKNSITEYLEIIPSLKPEKNIQYRQIDSEQKTEEVEQKPFSGDLLLTVPINEAEELKDMEKYITSWDDLQSEVREIQELFIEFHATIHKQEENVSITTNNIDVAHENVAHGFRNIAYAAKLKPAMYPVAGAVIGTCLGGPIGLLAGLKVGGVAAMGCGILGFTGGRILHKKKQQLDDEEERKNL